MNDPRKVAEGPSKLRTAACKLMPPSDHAYNPLQTNESVASTLCVFGTLYGGYQQWVTYDLMDKNSNIAVWSRGLLL